MNLPMLAPRTPYRLLLSQGLTQLSTLTGDNCDFSNANVNDLKGVNAMPYVKDLV